MWQNCDITMTLMSCVGDLSFENARFGLGLCVVYACEYQNTQPTVKKLSETFMHSCPCFYVGVLTPIRSFQAWSVTACKYLQFWRNETWKNFRNNGGLDASCDVACWWLWHHKLVSIDINLKLINQICSFRYTLKNWCESCIYFRILKRSEFIDHSSYQVLKY